MCVFIKIRVETSATWYVAWTRRYCAHIM